MTRLIVKLRCLAVWQPRFFQLWIISIWTRFFSLYLIVWFGTIGLSLWGNRITLPIVFLTLYLSKFPSHDIGGYAVGSLQDYFGLLTVGQVGVGNTFSHSALPIRAYSLIWNQWFRDENLQNSVTVDKGDGPDSSPSTNYILLRRGKRHDYFTSALPWPQKGGSSVTLPLGTSAPVAVLGSSSGSATQRLGILYKGDNVTKTMYTTAAQGELSAYNGTPTANYSLFADLSQATAATINQLRQSFQIQKLLERDARGGTRYTEIITAHFGVRSPDSRLQRPEYLGGGSTLISINPIAQTGGTGASGTSTPQGNLAAFGTYLANGHGFTQSFVEHGHVIGLVSVRADLTYQQGLRRFWSRSTRYDFYFPAFATLGEQAVLNKEILCAQLKNMVPKSDKKFFPKIGRAHV